MDKDRDRHKTEYDLDQLLKESFRMDDKSLLERFQRAQTEIDDSQIPPEPEDGFERLLDKIEEKGIEPQYIRDRETESRSGKRRRLKPMLKVALVAAVVVGVMMATTLTVGAKKYFTYRKTVRASVRNDVVLDNDQNKNYEGRLERAYREIEKSTGISAVRLEDIPPEMIYLRTEINGQTATMTFEYKENVFHVVQQIKDMSNSTNIISDRNDKDQVYNKWINQNIEIQNKLLHNGEIEYSAEIIKENSYYYLAGIMEKEVFIKIVENLNIEQGVNDNEK
ncbi:DUF4367 domain-containing protein [[Clostridium] symbiosum]|uniref:DUF4367 domain-containing protein n=1 Tax=Clostridium symbiosum TaxID=1512 RepID=UPI00232E19CC|nr:DUF4367 domain-containing protein [[Clostridium] symbiosum]MDB2008254.1 DUF4367 domain-containing protein [[Clostridium] symbiosum]MDB2025659.1 DUF4367 domain-containing protein [[Clostridium] symbiosum]